MFVFIDNLSFSYGTVRSLNLLQYIFLNNKALWKRLQGMEQKLGWDGVGALIWAFLRHGILAGVGMIPSFLSDQSYSGQPAPSQN